MKQETEVMNRAEIRSYIYEYLKDRDIKITEFHDSQEKASPYWVHLEDVATHKSTTALGPDQDAALFMALANFLEPKCNFVSREISRRRVGY